MINCHDDYDDYYEQVEVIQYRGLYYPNRCTQCDGEVSAGATVFPLAEAIFCSDECAAEWFGSQCETINSIREEGTGTCMLS